MSGLFANGLVLPAMVLALMGWLVPRGLSLIFPEGIRPLALLAFTAIFVMYVLGVVFFLALYLWQGTPLDSLFETGIGSGLLHFGRLGLVSALLWGPILILSVAGLPRHWIKETW